MSDYLTCEYTHPSMVAPASRILFSLAVTGPDAAGKFIQNWENVHQTRMRTGANPRPELTYDQLVGLPGIWFFYVPGNPANTPTRMWMDGEWITPPQDLLERLGYRTGSVFGLKIYLKKTLEVERINRFGEIQKVAVLIASDGPHVYVEMHFDTELQRAKAHREWKALFPSYTGDQMLFSE